MILEIINLTLICTDLIVCVRVDMNVCVCKRNNHNHYLVVKDMGLEGCLVCSFKYRVLFSGLKSLFVGVPSDKGVSRIRFKDWNRTVNSSHRAKPCRGR